MLIGPAFGVPEDSCTLGPDSVHDGPHVIHSLLECWYRAPSVGKPGSSLVENNDAAEG